ncbi:MAG: preprotein translocase subunit SecE [Clostridia bacterium]|nr:preprotein translocase subunit SecE [Clostridia bacterium]
MANVQDVKALKAAKMLRLMTILLLVVGIVTLAACVYDMVSGDSLLKLFDAKAASESAENATQTIDDLDTNHGGLAVARVMLIAAAALLILGSLSNLLKGKYRVFQGTCIAAIIFSLFPLIFFAVNIGKHLFALIFALLALAIIILAIFAMKSRWQVYIKEMTGEVKKLTWLSMKELVKATAVVLVFVLAFALLIYLLDLAFYTPVRLLLDDGSTPVPTATSPALPTTPAETEVPATDAPATDANNE